MKHLAGLSQIWREAFHEDDRYIDFFISEGLPLGHLLTYGPKVSPYAALTLFPISLVIKGIDYKGYYLYGLGTLTSERGKGYGSLLVEKAKEFAKERGRHFILLQPTDHNLFAYYNRLGFRAPVFRCCIDLTRSSLLPLVQMPNSHTSRLTSILYELSAPMGSQMDHYDCFRWGDDFLEYVNNECQFRGGAVVDRAFCYVGNDEEGRFLEIKEFAAEQHQLTSLVGRILERFPNIERFRFYGKMAQGDVGEGIEIEEVDKVDGDDGVTCVRNEKFALVNYLDPILDECHHLNTKYFALGMD